MISFRIFVVALLPALSFSLEVPAGTVIPVKLDSGLNAAKDRAGKSIKGKIMQDVFLLSGRKIPKRSEIWGHIVSVNTGRSSGTRIVLTFDTVHDGERILSVNTAVLALASTRHTWLQGSSVAKLKPDPMAGCPTGPGYELEQALWIFSGAACGTYRLGGIKIARSISASAPGKIELVSRGKLSLHPGTAWLLIVVAE